MVDKQLKLDFDRSDAGNLTFDAIIVAAPQTFDKNPVQFFGFDKNFSFPGKFHLTVATIVRGEVKNEFFGLDAETSPTLFIVDRNSNVNSVSKEFPVDYIYGDEGEKSWPLKL